MNTLSCNDGRVVTLVGIVLWLASCAGPARLTLLSGACEVNFEACLEGCKQLKDPYDCRLQCRFRGKLCGRDLAHSQARGFTAVGQIQDEASIVDLSGLDPLHSRSAKVKTSAGVQRKGSAVGSKKPVYFRVLPPGNSITIDYQLPAQTRRVELVLRHGPAGVAPQCFLTVMLDDETLVGRYSPPRSVNGALHTEKWDLTNFVRKTKLADGKRVFRLLILNNQSAGSRDDYWLSSVELYFQIEH
jgi:hypothetical protein